MPSVDAWLPLLPFIRFALLMFVLNETHQNEAHAIPMRHRTTVTGDEVMSQVKPLFETTATALATPNGCLKPLVSKAHIFKIADGA